MAGCIAISTVKISRTKAETGLIMHISTANVTPPWTQKQRDILRNNNMLRNIMHNNTQDIITPQC
jgi:hypothetical protein